MSKFNKQEAEHELKRMELDAKLSYPFALKMASLICFSVVSSVSLLGFFFGEKTPLTIGLVIFVALILGLISYKTTYAAAL